jgi:hypothetical protein
MGKFDIVANTILLVLCIILSVGYFRIHNIRSNYQDKFSKNICTVSDIQVYEKFGVNSDKYVLTGDVSYTESDQTYNVTTYIDKISAQSELDSLIEYYENNEISCYTDLNKVHIDKITVNDGKLIGWGITFLVLGILMLLCVYYEIKKHQNDGIDPYGV